jgi:Trk-type K+ transport system membrane component
MMTYKPDFEKRSTKIACWITGRFMNKFMDVLIFLIIIGAASFTYAVDRVLGIEDEMRKSNAGAEQEVIYIPILILGFFVSLVFCYLMIRVVKFVVFLVDRKYHDWYYKT